MSRDTDHYEVTGHVLLRVGLGVKDDLAGNKTGDRYWFMTSTMTWDDENRPTRDETSIIASPTVTTTMTYDGAGTLTRWRQGSTETKLVWDLRNLLLETDGAGATQAMYTLQPLGFGNLVSMRRLVGGNWTRRYFHYNAIGTADRLTDETQTVTDRYQMDPWGKWFTSSGTTVNPFTYVGQLGYWRYNTSVFSEACYVRARHYEPGFGRWWSRDPVPQNIRADVHAFRYVLNMPTLITDPSGATPDDSCEIKPPQKYCKYKIYYAYRKSSTFKCMRWTPFFVPRSGLYL